MTDITVDNLPVQAQHILNEAVKALRSDDLAKLKGTVQEYPKLIDHPYFSGDSLLHFAAQFDAPRCLTWLIEKGAEINRNGQGGSTPLIKAAAIRGSIDCTRLLIAAGADIDAMNNDGYTALMIASQWKRTDVKRCGELLIEAGASLNLKSQSGTGNTALMLAVFADNIDFARLLIMAKCDLNLTNVDGETALMHAVWKDSPEFIVLLLEAGADLSIRDRMGRTAYERAIEHNKINAADCLKAVIEKQRLSRTVDVVPPENNQEPASMGMGL